MRKHYETNKMQHLCIHYSVPEICIDCKLDYLKANLDKNITGQELLDIITTILKEVKCVENHVQEVEEKCSET